MGSSGVCHGQSLLLGTIKGRDRKIKAAKKEIRIAREGLSKLVNQISGDLVVAGKDKGTSSSEVEKELRHQLGIKEAREKELSALYESALELKSKAEEQLSNSQAEQEGAAAKIKSLEEQLVKRVDEAAKSREDMHSYRVEVEAKRATQDETIDKLREKLLAATTRAAAAEKAAAVLDTHIDSKKGEVQNLTTELSSTKEVLESVKEEAIAAQAHKELMGAHLEEKNVSIKDLRSEISELSAKLEAVTADSASAMSASLERRHKLESELAASRAEATSLRKSAREAELRLVQAERKKSRLAIGVWRTAK